MLFARGPVNNLSFLPPEFAQKGEGGHEVNFGGRLFFLVWRITIWSRDERILGFLHNIPEPEPERAEEEPPADCPSALASELLAPFGSIESKRCGMVLVTTHQPPAWKSQIPIPVPFHPRNEMTR